MQKLSRFWKLKQKAKDMFYIITANKMQM